MNNIGCIYLTKGQYKLANQYFTDAISMYDQWQNELKSNNSDISTNSTYLNKAKHILACRNFNKAYLKYLQTLKKFDEQERLQKPFTKRLDSFEVLQDEDLRRERENE